MIGRLAALALPVSIVAVALALAAAAAAWLRLVPPLPALGVFSLALLGGGGVSLVLGIVGLLRGADGRGAAMAATAIAVACLGLFGSLVFSARGAPPIHDITTNVDDAPQFVTAAASPANEGRDLAYPNGAPTTAESQQRAYPDIVPIELAKPPAEAFDAALQVGQSMGWSVVRSDAAAGIFEAESETGVFRFVDDVVVRVRPHDAGSVVDVRSLSREGVGDLGVNAARVRAFRDALIAVRR